MGQLGLATVVVGVEVEIRVQVVHVQVGAGGVEGFAAARRARTGAARQQVGVGQRRLGHARHLCAESDRVVSYRRSTYGGKREKETKRRTEA